MRASNFTALSRLLPQLVSLLAFIIGSVALLPTTGLAQGPENTLVVVNAESQDSLAIANLYIDLRGIPARNVIYLSGVKHHPTLGPETGLSIQFVQHIGRPIMAAIKERKLEKQISCITYSAGFPTRINSKPLADKYRENRDLRESKIWYGPYSSITSLTYFFNDAFSEVPKFFLDPNAANRYGSAPIRSWLTNPFLGEAGKQFDQAQTAIDAGRFPTAIRLLSKLRSAHPRQISVTYSLARAAAANGKHSKALDALSDAVSQGFHWGSVVLKEPAFKTLTEDERFKTLVASMGDSPDNIFPSRSFSAGNFWAPNGWPNGNPEQGQQYYLSTVLAVTGHARQSSLDSALKQIRRSCSADGTHPQASVYFAKHKDVRSRTREKQFDSAAEELRSLGVKPIIGSAKMVADQKALIGATLGSPKIDIEKSGSQFVPGAICDNLTSYGGWWGQKSQTTLNNYLDNGAAGASGTVVEPFAIASKFPTAQLHVHYARGCTLAESFYQSIVWPSQLLIVGDPLCCPYGKFPEFKVTGIENGKTVTKDFFLKIQQQADSPAIDHFEVFYDGVFLNEFRDRNRIKIAVENCDDGYHEIRIVGVTDSSVANRHTETVEFLVQRQGNSVTLNIENPECGLGEILRLRAVATDGEEIQIVQNFRTVATVRNNQKFEIAASQLGLGKTKLQALTVLPGGQTIRSEPVSISLSSSKLPDKMELKKSISAIRDLLKDQYQGGSAQDRKQLRQTTEESNKDPVDQYALLSECSLVALDFDAIELFDHALEMSQQEAEKKNLA